MEIDPNLFESQLRRQVSMLIEKDTTAWRTEYVCKPSFFYVPEIASSTLTIGSWQLLKRISLGIALAVGGVSEWAVSKKWWQGDIAVKNLLFLGAISAS